MTATYYKAVDSDGLSFFPFKVADRVNWVQLIGQNYALVDDVAWIDAVEKLRDGDTTCCTKHLLHGYADIKLAIDFGKRHAADRPVPPGWPEVPNFRIIEFTGDPVARLEGALLLERVPWNKDERTRFPDAVKYGFRTVTVLREVPAAELEGYQP